MLSFGALASKVFGSSNDRKLKKYPPLVAAINKLEPEVAALSLGWIGEAPMRGHGLALPDGADLFRRVVADGEHKIEFRRAGCGELVPGF